jgi:type II secretory pathway predicted ATPase ExeA
VDVSAEFSHLHPEMRQFADDSAESRIRRIRADRWVTYARAETALSRIEELMFFPKRTRMPNILIVGPTNNGKTMIVEKLRRAHSPIQASATESGIARIPVLKIQMPAGPDERRFFGVVLDALGFPYMQSDRVAHRQEAAVRTMRATGVSLLVIDELHNILSGTRIYQRRMLNLLRWLGNELQIPLVGAGTSEALHAVQSDDQLANRFEPLALPPWRDGDEYRQLLRSMEALLPLRRPSHLAQSALAGNILSAAEGILGEIVTVVTRAAVQAVKTGTEAISLKVIEETGFLPPSQRRRVAV